MTKKRSDVSRRSLLTATGAGLVTTLAGCGGGSNDGPEEDGWDTATAPEPTQHKESEEEERIQDEWQRARDRLKPGGETREKLEENLVYVGNPAERRLQAYASREVSDPELAERIRNEEVTALEAADEVANAEGYEGWQQLLEDGLGVNYTIGTGGDLEVVVYSDRDYDGLESITTELVEDIESVLESESVESEMEVRSRSVDGMPEIETYRNNIPYVPEERGNLVVLVGDVDDESVDMADDDIGRSWFGGDLVRVKPESAAIPSEAGYDRASAILNAMRHEERHTLYGVPHVLKGHLESDEEPLMSISPDSAQSVEVTEQTRVISERHMGSELGLRVGPGPEEDTVYLNAGLPSQDRGHFEQVGREVQERNAQLLYSKAGLSDDWDVFVGDGALNAQYDNLLLQTHVSAYGVEEVSARKVA